MLVRGSRCAGWLATWGRLVATVLRSSAAVDFVVVGLAWLRPGPDRLDVRGNIVVGCDAAVDTFT